MVSRTLYDDVATEAYEDYQAWLQDEFDWDDVGPSPSEAEADRRDDRYR